MLSAHGVRSRVRPWRTPQQAVTKAADRAGTRIPVGAEARSDGPHSTPPDRDLTDDAQFGPSFGSGRTHAECSRDRRFLRALRFGGLSVATHRTREHGRRLRRLDLGGLRYA